jgi:Glycerophosphoryl diester phosphodiesterase family
MRDLLARLSGLSVFLLLGSALGNAPRASAEQPAIHRETPQEAERRHERVVERRKSVDVICHRGASEHAHENTLEAFRATFELGGDGNEFDIRVTKDSVLVVFHDDMLDRLLVEAYGDVSDYTWEELQRFRFRNPGRFGAQCRIPTLVEVFELHRRYGGLIHLDIKRPGLDTAIAELLTRMDLWDQVAYCNTQNGAVILRDPRLRLRRYKAPGLYSDRSEVFPNAIAAALKKPGDGLIVDDPRGVAIALGRKPGKLSMAPVSPRPMATPQANVKLPGEAELIALIAPADDWDRVAETAAARTASGQRIRARAMAAEQLLAAQVSSKEAFAALEERVRKRSLHKDWMYHGLDGAMALRSLILLRAPNALETARLALWRDDPALEPVIDRRWKNPRAWTDFRVKMVIWPALEKCPGSATEKLCRDYLALNDEDARKLGPPQFEEAAKALLAVSPRIETALELMKHRLQVVRGRAILDCLTHAGEEWASAALERAAPHALAYRVND